MGINIKSASAVKKHAYQLLKEQNLNSALCVIHDFVEKIITEPLCTSQIFSSVDLDELCQEVGKVNFDKIKAFPTHAPKPSARLTFTYIVTKLQKSGGHTRVILDFIKARPNAVHIILVTELDGRSDIEYLRNNFSDDLSVEFEVSPKGCYLDCLTWLQLRLLEIRADDNYLFNHHQDSVAVAAIQPEMQLKASFYHHGDHHLCLGVHLSHLEHIDPHPMGYHYCRDELNIENTYIPFSIDDKGARATEPGFFTNGYLTSCTVGRKNKIELPYYASYVDIVPALLKATGGKHVHIGKLSYWALFKIRRGLNKYGVDKNRFVYVPWVSSVWNALHEFEVDLYIASFPYGGGITLIEAMGAGIPVVLHKHIYSRVLSGIDLAYPNVFYWTEPEKLIEFCANVSADTLSAYSKLARDQYEFFHRRHVLKDVLLNGARMQAPKNIISEFKPQKDEWAYWMAGQVTLTNTFSRGIYRLLKRVRGYYKS